jgi:peptide/nickel transport system substrate-binding protein
MALRALLGTRDPARGWGSANNGFYANPAMDALLDQALSTLDATRREALVAQATELGMQDVGLIPLHYQMAIWGMRKGLTYKARSDSYTFAFEIRPTPER